MRLVRTTLRLWITLSASFSFVVGWFLLAHAPKPIQPKAFPSARVGPLPTLAPLAPLDLSGASGSGNAQTFGSNVPQQSQRFVAPPPMFMTGGS